MHLWYITVASVIYHWCIFDISLLHLWYITVASVIYHCCISDISLLHKWYITVASVTYHCCINDISPLHQWHITVTSVLNRFITDTAIFVKPKTWRYQRERVSLDLYWLCRRHQKVPINITSSSFNILQSQTLRVFELLIIRRHFRAVFERYFDC